MNTLQRGRGLESRGRKSNLEVRHIFGAESLVVHRSRVYPRSEPKVRKSARADLRWLGRQVRPPSRLPSLPAFRPAGVHAPHDGAVPADPCQLDLGPADKVDQRVESLGKSFEPV